MPDDRFLDNNPQERLINRDYKGQYAPLLPMKNIPSVIPSSVPRTLKSIPFAIGDGMELSGFGNYFFGYGGALMNIGGSMAGIAEIASQIARRFDNGGGPKYIARTVSWPKGSFVGTQTVGRTLRSFQAGAKSGGAQLGVAGGILATVDYVSNLNDKTGYDHANYWIGTILTIGAFMNPIVAGVALVYGNGQGVSWLYNGKSLEENVGESIGW